MPVFIAIVRVMEHGKERCMTAKVYRVEVVSHFWRDGSV
jgi:hypothetical protein